MMVLSVWVYKNHLKTMIAIREQNTDTTDTAEKDPAEALADAFNVDWGGDRPGEEPGLVNIMSVD